MILRRLCSALPFLPLFLTIAVCGTIPDEVLRHFDTSTASAHLHFLARDEMRGRNTPSPELERAASYIAGKFKDYGLEPVNGSYLRDYTLRRSNLELSTSLYVNDVRMELKTDFIPFEQTGEDTLQHASVIFAGFGITAPEFNYDDYAGIESKGKVVLVMRGEPATEDSARGFLGKAYTRHSTVTEKVKNAIKHGATAVLVVDAPRGDRRMFITGFSWPSLFPNLPKDAIPLSLPATGTARVPVLHVGEHVVATLFGHADSLRHRVALIDSLLTPMSMPLSADVSTSVALTHENITVHNVVGYLPGAQVPNEYVIMGAHYDHVGVGKPNADGDSIFNGADDNASGTTAVLMCAESFARSSVKPARGILFIAFSGEEKGLLGSKAYAADPAMPLASCAAMINVDMIGRCEQNKLSIGGDKKCPDLVLFNEEENAHLPKPYTLAYDIEKYFFRSDQASFAMKRIPVLFFFTGEHTDYHKVTDEISRINLADLVGITSLIARTTWRATEVPRTRYVPAGFEE